MLFSRFRQYPLWLGKIISFILPFVRVRPRPRVYLPTPATLERPRSLPAVDILAEDGHRLSRQIQEEDERAAGAIAVAGLSTLELDALLERLALRMAEVSGASVGAILLLDEEEGVLRPGAYHGMSMSELRDFKIPLGRGFAGRVASERRPIAILDAQTDNTMLNTRLKRRGVRSILGVPVMVGDKLLGVAHVSRMDKHVFTPVETKRIQGMAAQAALAIYHAMLHQKLEQANRELAAVNRRLQAVISAIPAGVAIVEAPDGKIVAANSAAEQLWGRPSPPTSGLNDLQNAFGLFRLSGEPVPTDELPMVRSLEKGETVAGEDLVLRQANGTESLVLLSSAPLHDADGNIEGAVAVFQDTSGMDLERVKDQFISVTAHELFTPLTIVKGTAQLLMRRLSADGGDQTTIDALRVIDGRANWMTYLLHKLVDAAELQLGPIHLRRGRVDLVLLAEATRRRMQQTTRKHELICTSRVDQMVGNWDRDRIDRVLTNLVENAIKYSPKGGKVEIEVETSGLRNPFDPSSGPGAHDWAVLRVRDGGIGIPSELQSHLFRRFYRAGPSTYQESAGLGLGLYIVSRIVAAHGGLLNLESEEGKGSVFSLALPLTQTEVAA